MEPGTLALLGGSFDPIHIGHLHIAEVLLSGAGFDGVLFVPAGAPAHKPQRRLALPEHRLRMVRRAVRYQPRFAVSDIELRRQGASYTIDTVGALHERGLIGDLPGLVVGDDLLADYRSWRDYRALASKVRFVVARRLADQSARAAALAAFEYEYTQLPNLLLDISSTEVRRRISHGESVRHLVPEPVRRYINRHRLYEAVA